MIRLYIEKSLYLLVWAMVFSGSGDLLAQCPAGASSIDFNYTGAVQTWTVPAGQSEIEVHIYGADGGNNVLTDPESGGSGAVVSGRFSVSPGDVLDIVVGGVGGNSNRDGLEGGAGGGGGSGIRDASDIVMLAAGGGGGAGGAFDGTGGLSGASASNAGGPGTTGLTDGRGGHGGGGISLDGGFGSGGGPSDAGSGGFGANGGSGSGANGGNGGWGLGGGGAGADGNGYLHAGGGGAGGGYTGGHGANGTLRGGGGGGGSYIHPSVTGGSATAGTDGGSFSSHGSVTICYNLPSLPVTLGTLSARPYQNQEVKLDWTTYNEFNNRGFEVLYATDSGNWRSIGFVEGHGTTNQKQEYSYVHDNPVKGNNYYKLKQIDFDGKFEISNIVSASFEGKDNVHINLISPNPNDGTAMNLDWMADDSGETMLKIYDRMGRVAFEQSVESSINRNQKEITFDNVLSPGLYVVEISSSKGAKDVLKLIVDN